MAENRFFPVFSEKNWWALKQQFKSSMPTTNINTNFLKTLFSLTSNNAANTSIINLKRLGLLDEDGKPTLLANEWRIDESYKSACEKMLISTYPKELLELFPDTNADRTKLKNWFMTQCSVGDNAAGQMAALFLLLRSGEIKGQKQTGAKPTMKKQTKKEYTAEQSVKGTHKAIDVDSPEYSSRDGRTLRNRPNLHIDLQIHISPESTPEQIETIFACMAKHLYGEDK